MSNGDPHGAAPQGVSVVSAAVIGTVCFAAFAILGLGMLSYFTDTDLISVEGLPLWPGVIGMAVAIAVFALMLRPVLARQHPTFPPIVVVGIVTVVAHLVAVWLGALFGGAGLAHATEAVSQLVVRGSSAVVLVAALIAAWIAVALRRTRSTPKWPWERDEQE